MFVCLPVCLFALCLPAPVSESWSCDIDPDALTPLAIGHWPCDSLVFHLSEFRREKRTDQLSLSRINTTQYPSYRLHKPQVASEGARAGAAGGPSAPVGGVAPRRTTVCAESVRWARCAASRALRWWMHAGCGLPGVALVDARGADDCEPAQHMPRGGAPPPPPPPPSLSSPAAAAPSTLPTDRPHGGGGAFASLGVDKGLDSEPGS